MDTIDERAVQALHDYVTANAEPIVNAALRNDRYHEHIALIDSLFADNQLSESVLYRHTDIVRDYSVGQIIQDKAYLSTTKSFCAYYGSLYGEHMTCYRIHLEGSDIKVLDVDLYLSDVNDEEEVILPRNLKMRVLSVKTFTPDTYNDFLQEVDAYGVMNYKTLIADGIMSYKVVDLAIE